MERTRSVLSLALCVASLALAGCRSSDGVTIEPAAARPPAASRTSAFNGVDLAVRSATLMLDNDDAFRAKIAAIRDARNTIDLAYFIYSGDESSSLFSSELVAAARRGARVRLLVDLWTNYKHLDLFAAMRREGAKGAGSLEVRYYNAPTRNMAMDAAYATLPCPTADKKACADWKTAEVSRLFSRGLAALNPLDAGRPAAIEAGHSGLFLSGIYTQNFELVRFAVSRGERVDPSTLSGGDSRLTPENVDKFTKLAGIFWTARAGRGFQSFVANIKLQFIRAIYGETLNPVFDAIGAFLPANRADFPDSARDWEHIHDFLHHKLLLADRERMIIGGRNVENSYHTQPGAFGGKERTFSDTDVDLRLGGGGEAVEARFEALWSYRPMIATLDEIRAIAPNDFAANFTVFKAAREQCEGAPVSARPACVERLVARDAIPFEARVDRQAAAMRAGAEKYRRDYRPGKAGANDRLNVDATATFAYLQNLPFAPGASIGPASRVYDPRAGGETAGGKHIHAWLAAALDRVCETASAARPRRVVINTAYLLLPSRHMAQLGRMLTGATPCANVSVTILTNSRETTDASVENQVNSHVLAALLEHVRENRDAARSATLDYHEFTRAPGAPLVTHHNKVWVIGDEVFVGSANADVRSFVMDSQNGILIRDAPGLVARYLAYVDDIRAKSGLTREMTDAYLPTTRLAVIARDLARLRARGARHAITANLSEVRWSLIDLRYKRLADQAFDLTRRILRGGADGRAAGDAFDRKFKMI